jgi:transposase InsO family protein
MAAENPTWGAPRIHGEIQKLGLEVSERTVSRYMPRNPAHPDEQQRWRTFLANHREVIAAMDFFTVPTVTFRVLCVFFVVHHARRELIHVRTTGHPTSAWITQQLREAFPYDQAPRYPILDRDAKYGDDVLAAIRHTGIEPRQITARSPWQNGVAERFVNTARREPWSRSRIQPPRSSLDLALAGFIIATPGAAPPGDLARVVHCHCFVLECVCVAEGGPPPSLSAAGHDRRRHTQGAFARRANSPLQAA